MSNVIENYPVPFNSNYLISKCFDRTVPSKRSVEGTVGFELRRQDSLQYHRIPGSIRIRLGTRSRVPKAFYVLSTWEGPVPRRKHIGARIALFPMRQRLSPYNCRVSFRIIPFRGLLDILCAVAHKTFIRVPAHMFAESPEATLLTKVLQTMSYLHSPP